MTRAEIEDAILIESRAVDEIVELLCAQTPLARWPAELQGAFILAITDHPSESITWQVVALRRHLFGPSPTALSPPSTHPADTRLAERLRADLPARLPLREARYLLDPSTT